MNTIQNINTAQAYLEGMLWAAYGVKLIGGFVSEWQIDVVKKYAKKLKEEEIDHSSLPSVEKENQKKQLEQWFEATAQGLKDELRREGRLLQN